MLEIPVSRVRTLAVGEEFTRRFTLFQADRKFLDIAQVARAVENDRKRFCYDVSSGEIVVRHVGDAEQFRREQHDITIPRDRRNQVAVSIGYGDTALRDQFIKDLDRLSPV
ncbi:MAG: hypothetical protein ACRDRU_13820 [Pseudonocardiaceae bacterium]